MGSLLSKTPEGLKKAPFYADHVRNNGTHFFDFDNARAVSGMTDTATPAIILGTLLGANTDDDATRNYFQIPTITTITKAMGYKTVLYCSYDTQYQGRWEHLNAIFHQFDEIYSRTTLGLPAVNEYGMDDRNLTAMIVKDLKTKYSQDEKFFILIIWNNLHYPFLIDESQEYYYSNEAGEVDRYSTERYRYLESISITDTMTKNIFETLEDTGFISNTVVAFTSDHGETPGEVYSRCGWPQNRILRVPLWFYIPGNVKINRELLNVQKRRTVSNLDVIPTLLEMLGLNSDLAGFGVSAANKTIIGQSLFQNISSSRVIAGYQGKPFIHDCNQSHAYLANATHVVFFRAHRNLVTLEIADPNNMFETVSGFYEQQWLDLPEYEQHMWVTRLSEEYPFILDQLKQCGFTKVG